MTKNELIKRAADFHRIGLRGADLTAALLGLATLTEPTMRLSEIEVIAAKADLEANEPPPEEVPITPGNALVVIAQTLREIRDALYDPDGFSLTNEVSSVAAAIDSLEESFRLNHRD